MSAFPIIVRLSWACCLACSIVNTAVHPTGGTTFVAASTVNGTPGVPSTRTVNCTPGPDRSTSTPADAIAIEIRFPVTVTPSEGRG